MLEGSLATVVGGARRWESLGNGGGQIGRLCDRAAGGLRGWWVVARYIGARCNQASQAWPGGTWVHTPSRTALDSAGRQAADGNQGVVGRWGPGEGGCEIWGCRGRQPFSSQQWAMLGRWGR